MIVTWRMTSRPYGANICWIGGGPQVFAAADVVQPVRQAVADEQADQDEQDRQRVQRGPEVGRTVGSGEREQRQRQHEDAVDHPEDPVMHDEERDQDGLARSRSGSVRSP